MRRISLAQLYTMDFDRVLTDSSILNSKIVSGPTALTAYDDECCPGVVDPLLVAMVIGAVVAGTLLLRQIALDTLGKRSFLKGWNQRLEEWIGKEIPKIIIRFSRPFN